MSLASTLAKKGRFGDTELVHMSKDEVLALEELAKKHGKKLTKNPKTGLSEAFSLGGLVSDIGHMFDSSASALTGGLVGGQKGSENLWGTSINQEAAPYASDLAKLGLGGAAAYLAYPYIFGDAAAGAGAGGATNAALMTDPVLGGEAGGGALWAPATSGTTFGTGAATNAAATALGGAAPSSAFNYSSLLNLAPPILNLIGQNKLQGQQQDLANQYSSMGAPYRQQLSELMANPSSYLSSPEVQNSVQQGTNATARSLSVNGNPTGSGNALQQLQDYSTQQFNNKLLEKQNQLATMGGLPTFNQAVPQQNTNVINSTGNLYGGYGALGSTLADIFNPPKPTAMDQYLQSMANKNYGASYG